MAAAARAADPKEGGDSGAVLGRGARERHRVPGVVELALVEGDAALDRARLARPERAQRRLLRQVPQVVGDPAPGTEDVVHTDARPHPGTVDEGLLQGVDELDRPREVRAQLLEDELALAQGLEHEMEVELLEVPQTAVHQLRRPARRPRGEVACLDQPDLEPTARSVQRGACADDPGTDHQDVELLLTQTPQGVRPVLRAERHSGDRHRSSPSTARYGLGARAERLATPVVRLVPARVVRVRCGGSWSGLPDVSNVTPGPDGNNRRRSTLPNNLKDHPSARREAVVAGRVIRDGTATIRTAARPAHHCGR